MDRLSSKTFVSLLSLGLVLLCTLNPVSGRKVCKIPAIFAFGNSNFETGTYSIMTILPQNPPYGETYFGRPSGRYSDGRILLDFIAQSFGLPLVHGYLDAVGANFSHGVSFATLGATITSPPAVSGFSLPLQYAEFLLFRSKTQYVRKQGGVWAWMVPEKKYYDDGLYVFDIGQNDIDGLLFMNWTVQQINATIPDKISAFAQNVTSVYNSGARNIWIFNIGPLGCLPYLLINFPFEHDAAGCIKVFNELVQYFNYKLKEAVVKLRKDLPLASITLIDVYSVQYDLISNAKKYGFEKPLEACCGYGGPPYNYNKDQAKNCGMTVVENGTKQVVGACTNPRVRVNWDGFHYTDAANDFIFRRIFTGAFSDPPLPLDMSCRRASNY